MSEKDVGIIDQEIGPLLDDTITIDLSGIGASGSTMSSTSYQYPTYSIGTTSGFNGTSGSYLTANTASGTSWVTNNTSPWSIGSTSPSPSPSLKVTGDAEFEGTVMINGRNISEFMETISKRLSILVPDPAKLEHFAALKKAYEHYKTLEALCELPKEESKD
jgi:hypothetical protein